MKKLETVDDLRDFLEKFFKERGKKVRIFLFGSRARGDHTQYSDVDIAIESDEDIDRDIDKLKLELEESLLPQKVDIVILDDKLDVSFKEEVLREGKLWIDLKNQ